MYMRPRWESKGAVNLLQMPIKPPTGAIVAIALLKIANMSPPTKSLSTTVMSWYVSRISLSTARDALPFGYTSPHTCVQTLNASSFHAKNESMSTTVGCTISSSARKNYGVKMR
jgi:hypothetical protein